MSGNSASDSKIVLSPDKPEPRSRFAPRISEAEPDIGGRWPRPARLVFLFGAALAAWAALIAAIVFLA